MSPTAAFRQKVTAYVHDAWVGPAGDQKLQNAFAPGTAFNRSDPDDVAPWTPEEVREQVGYTVLTYRFSTSTGGRLGSGLIDDGAGGTILASVPEEIWILTAQHNTPINADLEVGEGFQDAFIALFEVLTLTHDDPGLCIKTHGSRAPRRRGPTDNPPFQTHEVDVWLEVRAVRPVIGAVEVQI